MPDSNDIGGTHRPNLAVELKALDKVQRLQSSADLAIPTLRSIDTKRQIPTSLAAGHVQFMRSL
jgi:hypothetical protein